MNTPLVDLLDAPAPVVTVLLDARSDQPQALQQLELRWKNVRRDLEGKGVDDATLEAIGEALLGEGGHAGGDSVVVVAAGGRVLEHRHLPDPPPGDVDRATVGPVPHLLPLLVAEQTTVPHVVVLVDRVGADIYARTGPVGRQPEHDLSGDETVERSVDGDTEHIQRSSPGGWSQRRFQQRNENTWERNAGEAADEVVALADEVGAELVLVGGDVRAAGFLVDALPERLKGAVRELESGSRAEGSSIEHVTAEVQRLVRTAAAERLAAVLGELAEETGQHDRAAEGLASVVPALQTATVETLLVHWDDDDARTAWVGPEPLHLGLTRDDLAAGMGVEDPVEAPLVDACVRAAIGGGAEVVVAPASKLKDGLAAILRHTGATPPVPGQG